MSRPSVKFSGTDQGLLMRPEWETPLPQILMELEEHLQQSRSFFAGAHILLEVGRRPVLKQEMDQIALVLSRYGVTLHGVAPVLEGQDRHAPPAPAACSPLAETTTLHFEQRTVRSGERIACEGHLLILGDVNPGAEVSAGFNIFVWGSLRGSAYAGVPNREDAVIAALYLAPIQLRIAGYIARAPEARPLGASMPELARIDQHAIVVEAWDRSRFLQKRG